jgi:hypothetical protein
VLQCNKRALEESRCFAMSRTDGGLDACALEIKKSALPNVTLHVMQSKCRKERLQRDAVLSYDRLVE